MKLVIVESPTKARKLTGYLGQDFTIEASVGHIRDLPKSGLGIDIDHNYEPEYEISEDKTQVVSKLQKLAKSADTIILATDPDREGEAIAWHLQYLLQGNASKKKTADPAFVRATFHEITKQAVLDAIAHPSQVKLDLVNAQQARRVVDRLVGYKISPVLWRKVRRGLSAGRVQSVALRMIVEREREIEAFIPEEYWEVDVAVSADATFTKHDSKVKVPTLFMEGKIVDVLPDGVVVARVTTINGKKYLPTSENDVTEVVATLEAATTNYKVTDIEQKERTRASLPPFTTSTLQQQAATRLGFTSKQTMRLAQQLYEEGLITYHRTDSVTLSQTALDMARAYIAQEFGQNYLPSTPRVFANSSKNAQEAHEAIRVTDVSKKGEAILRESGQFTERHVKLYDLIWRRFLASQMLAAIYLQTAVTITAEAEKSSTGFKTAELKATGSVMKFAGWTTLFPNRDDIILPAVEVNQDLGYLATNPAQKFTQPPPRYNDASLVKELEKRGIGRPSTYASIISVIEDRGYVERDQKRFVATSVGMTVCDFLVAHFPTIMDYDFTAQMENDLDSVAEGGKEWHKVVDAFFKPLSKIIDTVLETAERAQVPVEKTGEKCPDCGEGEVVIRTGRFGKFKSCSRFPDCKYTQNIVETLENQVCPLCQTGQVVVKKSRWGKGFFGCSRYPECGWASWKKPEPGETITQAEWEELQAAREAKKAARAEKFGNSAATKKTPTKKTTVKKKKAPAKKTTAAKKSAVKKKTSTKKT